MSCMTKLYSDMMGKKILRIYGIIILVGLAYWLWIRLTGLQIPCLYLATTGLRCPGCGTTRMLLSLLRLDFGAAFSYNPVVFILFCMWNLIALLCVSDRFKWIQQPRILYFLLGLSIAVLVVFGILRNIT